VNITQREWAEKRCNTILDDCTCGYCNDTVINHPNNTETLNNEVDNTIKVNKEWEMDEFNFIFGMIVGCIGTLILMFGVQYCIANCDFCCKKRKMRRQYNEAVSDEDDSDANIEIEEIDNSQLFSGPDDKTTQK